MLLFSSSIICLNVLSDRICFYDTLLVQDGNYKQNELRRVSKKNKQTEKKNNNKKLFQWSRPFETTVGPLEFQSSYVFAVAAKGIDFDKESEKEYLYFNTTSCLDTLNGSTEMCVPEKPTNVRVLEFCNTNLELRIVISWDAPKYIPSGYVLHLVKYINNKFETERVLDVTKVGDILFYSVKYFVDRTKRSRVFFINNYIFAFITNN